MKINTDSKIKLKIPDFFTLGNICFGMISIALSLSGKHMYSAISILIAMFFDYLDGKTAKIMKNANDFGKELDSLSDLISFGVAPVIFIFTLKMNQFTIIASLIFICAGTFRLAKYNVTKFTGIFNGVPITVNGLLPILYIAGLPLYCYPYLLIAMAILMVSPLQIKKLK